MKSSLQWRVGLWDSNGSRVPPQRGAEDLERYSATPNHSWFIANAVQLDSEQAGW